MNRSKLALFVLGWLLCSAGKCKCIANKQPSFKAVLAELLTHDERANITILEISPRTSPAFPFVVCSNCACDVCENIIQAGSFAPVETAITSRYMLTQQECASAHGIVLDVGANVGYFSMMAAAAGCRVHAFEPNAAPRSMLALSAMVNEAHGLVKIHAVAISAKSTMGVMASSDAWGLNSVEPAGAAATPADGNQVAFKMRPVTDFVQRDILLLKVDTEGYEANVFRGAWGLLRSHKVHNVIAEIKEYNDPDKRQLIQRIMVTGRFKAVYNYDEAYGESMDFVEGALLAPMIHDITPIIRDDLTTWLDYEDFWFKREPLPDGHFVPYSRPQ